MRPARSLSPALPPIEFDAGREPEPGGVGSPGRFVNDSGRWAWIAIGACVALLVAIVVGGHDSGEQSPTSVTPPQPQAALASIHGGGLAVTVQITNIDVGEWTHHTYFAVTGSGGVPDRRYDLQVGQCPSTTALFAVGLEAQINGAFSGSLDTPGFGPESLLWMRVVDENGMDEGGAEVRLGGRAFWPIVGGGQPCQGGAGRIAGGAGRIAVTTLERPAHFTDRRATLSPPTDIGVDVVSPAEVIATIEPLGAGAHELILGHYDDAEIGLTLDPAWIIIDRGVVTSDLDADGVTHAFHSTNVVRVVNAVTGRLVFTFTAPGEPVMMSQ